MFSARSPLACRSSFRREPGIKESTDSRARTAALSFLGLRNELRAALHGLAVPAVEGLRAPQRLAAQDIVTGDVADLPGVATHWTHTVAWTRPCAAPSPSERAPSDDPRCVPSFVRSSRATPKFYCSGSACVGLVWDSDPGILLPSQAPYADYLGFYGGGEGTRTPEPLDCQSSALPAELRPRVPFALLKPGGLRSNPTSGSLAGRLCVQDRSRRFPCLGGTRRETVRIRIADSKQTTPENQRGDLIRRCLIDLAGHVAVDIGRDADRRVPEAVAHDLERDTCLQGSTR